MIDKEFKAESDKILANRMRQYKELTAITGGNTRKGELSWYLNKRDRPRVQLFQRVREIDDQFVQGQDYRVDDSGEVIECNPLGNPDILSEEQTFWPQIVTEGNTQQELSEAMNIAYKQLSKQEVKVFALLRQGFGTTDIATHLGLKQSTAGTLLQRIQKKMRAAREQENNEY